MVTLRACGAAVAQATHNRLVVGSNPTGPTHVISRISTLDCYKPGCFLVPIY